MFIGLGCSLSYLYQRDNSRPLFSVPVTHHLFLFNTVLWFPLKEQKRFPLCNDSRVLMLHWPIPQFITTDGLGSRLASHNTKMKFDETFQLLSFSERRNWETFIFQYVLCLYRNMSWGVRVILGARDKI